MLKFVNLLNARNKSVLINLGKSILHATKQRNNYLSSLTEWNFCLKLIQIFLIFNMYPV